MAAVSVYDKKEKKMTSKRCRLYDENLVRNIMLSTGLSVLEYVRENADVNSDEICDFVETNAEIIVNNTINQLKSMNAEQDMADGPDAADTDDGENSEEETDEWPGRDVP